MAVAPYLDRFANNNETEEFVFPRNRYEMSITQSLRNANAAIVGKSYGVRLIGTTPALKALGTATVRFWIVDDTTNSKREEMETKLYGYGQGYLKYSDDRKALASLASMPEIEIVYNNPRIIVVVLTFDIWEDFNA